jgi:hypothetical protein
MLQYNRPSTVVNVSPTPVTGRFLAHNRLPHIGRAFHAADLHAGNRYLVTPTIVQAAVLCRVNRTTAWWAVRQMANRVPIEAGILPLVPRSAPAPTKADLSDNVLFDIVAAAGIDRILTIAASVEQTIAS